MNLVSSALAFLMIAGLLGDPLSEMREEPTTIWALPLDNPAGHNHGDRILGQSPHGSVDHQYFDH